MAGQHVIVAGWYLVDPAKRADFIASFEDLITRARKAPGCLDLAISADAVDPSRVNNFELWESEEHLDAWRKVANPPKPVTQMTAVNMGKHAIARSGPPFE
ncbi:MAG TPA: antibiotic biosynthesis monooxygenase family protein [Luteimonas sp.]|nr:antibiotic biosynthesis monooxygenase family protein [Luteimonas sp.]